MPTSPEHEKRVFVIAPCIWQLFSWQLKNLSAKEFLPVAGLYKDCVCPRFQ